MASNPSRRKLTSGCLEIGTKGGCLTALTEAIKLYRKAVREKIDHVSTRSNQCVLNRRQDSDVLQSCANVGFSFVSFMDWNGRLGVDRMCNDKSLISSWGEVTRIQMRNFLHIDLSWSGWHDEKITNFLLQLCVITQFPAQFLVRIGSLSRNCAEKYIHIWCLLEYL